VSPEFFERVTGLEMGRSYILDKYQRAYSALLLLWRGIGQMVLRFPHYRYLFGPVSVSNQYRPLSRRVIVRYMERSHPSPLAHLVKPRRPARFLTRKSRLIKTVLERVDSFDEMSDIVMDIEGGNMGAPILLKQYIKLGCKSCGWNLDPDFGKTLDCFICADLTQADPKTLKFYMGKEGYQQFMEYHNK
jgi:putative hemolysin